MLNFRKYVEAQGLYKTTKSGRIPLSRTKLPPKAGFDYTFYGVEDPVMADKKKQKEMLDLSNRLSKIRYFEAIRKIPWIVMLLKGLEDVFGIDSKTSYQQRFDDLKNGKYYGAKLDRLLKMMDHDFGSISQKHLKTLVPLLNFTVPNNANAGNLASDNGMITKRIVTKMVGSKYADETF